MACKSKSFFLIKPHAFALGFGFYLFQVYFFGRILFCFRVLKQQDSRRHTETLKEEKNKQTTKQTSRSQTECRFPSFSIYQNVHFLHYLVMNENFCGVTLDVLLCVLNRACLPAVTEYTALSQLSRAHVVVNYLLCFDQTDITRERFNSNHTQPTPVQSYCTPERPVLLLLTLILTISSCWQAWPGRLIMQLGKHFFSYIIPLCVQSIIRTVPLFITFRLHPCPIWSVHLQRPHQLRHMEN